MTVRRRTMFREAGTRRIAATLFVALGLLVSGLFALAVWGLPVIGRPGLSGAPAGVLWAATLLSVAVAWWLLDRRLEARFYDRRHLPARPEFYDFRDLNQPMHWDEIAGRSLRQLRFVVFDTETTGLRPSQGDEIISIGAVEIAGGVIDETHDFSRLVNPGIPIPASSTRFHGIRDATVATEPALSEVLPAFRDFVGDAVLVAHNAAFDMRFLELKQEATGVTFPNLVLDTLLISVFLDHESENHSLDAIAQRMGLSVEGRHTALGDALLTARVFLGMLDRLEARGVTTLRRVVELSAQIERVRKLRERF